MQLVAALFWAIIITVLHTIACVDLAFMKLDD